MKKTLLLFFLSLMVVGVKAEDVVYCSYSFETEEVPEGFLTYDVDDQPLHYTATQYGFEQGVAWMAQREENVTPYNYFVATFARHKAKSGASTVLPTEHWLVMPAVYVRQNNAKMAWRSNSITLNLEKTSTYSVRVSATGNKPEDFTDAALLTVDADSLDGWVEHEVSLAAYTGKQVYIAFVNTTNQGEMLGIDDIVVSGGKGDFDFTTNTENYVYGVETFTPTLTFTQLTENKITSFTAHCVDVSTGLEKSTTMSGISLSAGSSLLLPLTETVQVQYGDTLRYRIWLTVNGANTDEIRSTSIFLSFEPEQHVVIESGTGSWCGWCPQGIVALQRMKEKYGNLLLPICVHSDDVMTVDGYIGNTGISFPGGYPSGHINRRWSTAPLVEIHEGRKSVWSTLHGGYETYFLKALAEKPFAEVKLQAEVKNNKIEAKATVRCCIPKTKADVRIAYILTEDSWSSNTVAQKNYIPGQGYELDGWESKPSQIPGYAFKDVARGAANNAFRGIDAKIPAAMEVDTPYEHEVTISIPKAVGNIQNCSLTAMLIDNATGYIINAMRVSLDPTGIEDVDVDADVDGNGKFLENGKIVIVKNNAKYNVAGQRLK